MKLLKSILIYTSIIAIPFAAKAQDDGAPSASESGYSCDFYHKQGVIYQLAKHKYMVEKTMSNVINGSKGNKDAAIDAYAELKMSYDAATTQFVYEMSGRKSLSKTFDRINWAFIKDREKEYCYECEYAFPYGDGNCHYCVYHLHPRQVRWYAQAINDYIRDCEAFCAKYNTKSNHVASRYVDMGISDLLSSVDLSHGIYRMHANRREFLSSLLLQLKPESVRELKEYRPYYRVVYRDREVVKKEAVAKKK